MDTSFHGNLLSIISDYPLHRLEVQVKRLGRVWAVNTSTTQAFATSYSLLRITPEACNIQR